MRVKYIGINPIDLMVIEGNAKAQPMPHVPGAKLVGVVERVGPGVSGLAEGDPVVVYYRLYCGSCRYCLTGETQLCTSGGIIGVAANGGFAEYAVVLARNLVKTRGDLLKLVGLPRGRPHGVQHIEEGRPPDGRNCGRCGRHRERGDFRSATNQKGRGLCGGYFKEGRREA